MSITVIRRKTVYMNLVYVHKFLTAGTNVNIGTLITIFLLTGYHF